jgi:hypothetical protein
VVTETLSENEASVWVVMNDPLVYLHRERERIMELQGSVFGKTSRI